MKGIIFSFSFFLFLTSNTLARPQYAVQQGYVNCTACHVSPFGGGPKTVNGKLFAARGMEPGPLAKTDLVSGDFRAIALYPHRAHESPNGFALMTVAPAVNIPVTLVEPDSDTRFVAAYNFGVLSSGIREAYILFRTAHLADSAFIKHITVGRFYVPFGIITDEHRTWARLQNKTTLNDFEMGVAISGDPTHSTHYDLALTNGFQSGGALTSVGELTWAGFSNLRWQPPVLPFFLGASGSYHHTSANAFNPYAGAIYSALSLNRLTSNLIPGSFLTEVQLAKGWNESSRNAKLISTFSPTDTSFTNAIRTTQSLGLLAQLNLDLTQRLTLIYKFEQFMFHRNYPADAFVRHGMGFKYTLSSNLSVDTRYEHNKAKRPQFNENNSPAARNTLFALLHLQI